MKTLHAAQPVGRIGALSERRRTTTILYITKAQIDVIDGSCSLRGNYNSPVYMRRMISRSNKSLISQNNETQAYQRERERERERVVSHHDV